MNRRDVERMQQKLIKMQTELENALFTGTAGGGAVTITMNGKYEVSTVKIDPEAFNPEDIAELEVMVLAAIKDTHGKVSEAQERLTMNMTGGLKIPGLF